MRVFLAFGLSVLAGCAGTPSSIKPAALAEPQTQAMPLALTLPGYPQTPEARPTTSAENVLAHLNGRIEAATGSDARAEVARSGALYQRYQILGDLADLDEAYRLAKIHAAATDARAETLLLWALIASHQHQFDAAIQALDRLAPGEQRLSADIREDIARARSMRPIPTLLAELKLGREFATLRDQAANCIDQGDLNCATEHFHRAQFFYTDSAPLPLAWLHTQQGIALLRFGHPDWAIRFFRAALVRMPDYYLAAEHLGECLGLTQSFDEGRSVYERVIAQTGNPEYVAGLASLERAAGNSARADTLMLEAKAGFAQRLELFPDAYALHAVDFYLEINDLATANQLAKRNLELRQDASAWLLQAEVDLASGRADAACSSLKTVQAAGYRPPEWEDLRLRLPRCKI